MMLNRQWKGGGGRAWGDAATAQTVVSVGCSSVRLHENFGHATNYLQDKVHGIMENIVSMTRDLASKPIDIFLHKGEASLSKSPYYTEAVVECRLVLDEKFITFLESPLNSTVARIFQAMSLNNALVIL